MIFGWCFFLLLKRCFIYGIILWLLGFSCRRCWKVKILVLWSSPSLDAETPTTLPRSFSHSEKFNIVVNAMHVSVSCDDDDNHCLLPEASCSVRSQILWYYGQEEQRGRQTSEEMWHQIHFRYCDFIAVKE